MPRSKEVARNDRPFRKPVVIRVGELIDAVLTAKHHSDPRERQGRDLGRQIAAELAQPLEGVAVRRRSRRDHVGAAAAVVRVTREAVTNAVRHARAGVVSVELRYDAARVCLAVSDDGAGVAAAALDGASARGHWGVRGMRERAERVGGTFRIGASAAGSGCRLETLR